MIVIIGLAILIVAAVAGVDAVLGNGGHGHALSSGFSMLGYHVTGSTGTLFLNGIVVGAVATLGLVLLLGGARRTSRRGSSARRSLKHSRRQTAAVSQDRDDLLDQRQTAQQSPASTAGNGTPASTAGNGTPASTAGNGTPASSPGSRDDGISGWMHQWGRRFGPQPATISQQAATPEAAAQPEPPTAPPVPDILGEEPAPAQSAANGARA